MPSYFCDTSAIVKRYVLEKGSGYINDLTDPQNGNLLLLSRITTVEFAAAIARRLKGNNIAKADSDDALYAFNRDFANKYVSFDVTNALLSVAADLATNHALRAYDAVQLAAALKANAEAIQFGLPPIVLISADGELNTAAIAEGLNVENPNDHP